MCIPSLQISSGSMVSRKEQYAVYCMVIWTWIGRSMQQIFHLCWTPHYFPWYQKWGATRMYQTPKLIHNRQFRTKSYGRPTFWENKYSTQSSSCAQFLACSWRTIAKFSDRSKVTTLPYTDCWTVICPTDGQKNQHTPNKRWLRTIPTRTE